MTRVGFDPFLSLSFAIPSHSCCHSQYSQYSLPTNAHYGLISTITSSPTPTLISHRCAALSSPSSSYHRPPHSPQALSDTRASSSTEARPTIAIREDANKGVFVAGLLELEVKSAGEMISLLHHAGKFRATASTCMNQTSSRSHAVCTITLEQDGILSTASATASASSTANAATAATASPTAPAIDGNPAADACTTLVDSSASNVESESIYRIGKFHLVDLAGSERAKRTQASGERLKEGININKGLLALGESWFT